MSDRSGLSRGVRNRNARLARLWRVLPAGHAIVGIDLADDRQAAVVTDHDSQVLARRTVTARHRRRVGRDRRAAHSLDQARDCRPRARAIRATSTP